MSRPASGASWRLSVPPCQRTDSEAVATANSAGTLVAQRKLARETACVNCPPTAAPDRSRHAHAGLESCQYRPPRLSDGRVGEGPDEQARSLAESGSDEPVSVRPVVVAARTETGSGRGRSPCPRPARRSGMALRSKLGPAQSRRRRPAGQGAIAACRLHGSAIEPRLRRGLQGVEEPLLPRRRDRADAVAGLGRRLDVEAERLRGGRPDDRRRRRRGQFRPRAQSAARREGRRPQLPGHIQRRRLAADLDAKDERRHPARRFHRRRLLRGDRSRSRRSRSRRARSGGSSTTPSRRRRAATSRAAAA